MSLLELPNPLTPLAWLALEIAVEFETPRYIVAATVGAWFWDVLMSLSEETRIFKQQIKIPDVIYILARVGTGAFILTSFMFNVASVDNCEALVRAVGWTGAFSIPLNSLLFLFRIHAVFHGCKPIICLFTCLWVATTGASFTAPFSLAGIHIGTTNYCIPNRVKSYGSAGIVTAAANDTLVSLAITVRLVMNSQASSWSERFKTFFSGEGMGNISRAIMQGGQLYYLATVGFNIAAATVILTPSVPAIYGNVLSVPNGALQNAIASRVYRQLKLGYLKDVSVPMRTASMTFEFNADALGTGSNDTNDRSQYTSDSGPYSSKARGEDNIQTGDSSGIQVCGSAMQEIKLEV